MEPKGLFLYYKSNNSPKSLLYSQLATVRDGLLDNVTLSNALEEDKGNLYEPTLELYPHGGTLVLDVPKFNSTLTYLKLGIDENIKLHTYYGAVDSWEVTFTLFDRDSVRETECQLSSRCGEFGICEDNQCVACPLSNGLVGWNTSCVLEKLTSCDPKSFHYYKVEGVDYFSSKYTRGSSTKETNCGKKCTPDCKCLGYFYNKDTSRCWIAYDLKTLTKVASPRLTSRLLTTKFP